MFFADVDFLLINTDVHGSFSSSCEESVAKKDICELILS
jgi:hypothetical protein